MTAPALLTKQSQWPLIARDIVMMTQPGTSGNTFGLNDILKTYEMTEAEFVALSELPAFQSIVKSEVERIKSLGPFAGQRLRAELLASDLQENLFVRAKTGLMDDKQAIQLLMVLMKSAGTDMPQDAREASKPETSVNIAFNIPTLPTNKKLSHLMPAISGAR